MHFLPKLCIIFKVVEKIIRRKRMIYSKLLETLSTIIKDPGTREELERRFVPILDSDDLVSTITSLSKESPIFQKSLSNLVKTLEEYPACEFADEYINFYNNVMILSDELALTIKKEADMINNIDIPVRVRNEVQFVSSRIFVGNSMLLVITSNDDIFSQSLKPFEAPSLNGLNANKSTSA